MDGQDGKRKVEERKAKAHNTHAGHYQRQVAALRLVAPVLDAPPPSRASAERDRKVRRTGVAAPWANDCLSLPWLVAIILVSVSLILHATQFMRPSAHTHSHVHESHIAWLLRRNTTAISPRQETAGNPKAERPGRRFV